MAKKLNFNISVEGKKLKCELQLSDSSLIGKKAVFRLFVKVNVNDSRAVNSNKEIYKKNFIIDSINYTFQLDLKDYVYYTYIGEKISVELVSEIKVDDSMFFDTKISKKVQNEILKKPKVLGRAKEIIDPKDTFNLLDNMKAIPYDAKIFVIILIIAGLIVMAINTFLGIHDQFVPENQTYFYSHYDSDGDSSSPFFAAIAGSGTIGAGIWFMIKTQLRRYAKLFIKKINFLGAKDKLYKVSEIIGGKSRVDLKDIKLKIVACNMEKGQYKRGSGTNTRTVSFSESIRAVQIYEKDVEFIPARTDISDYFRDDISFEKMYRILYPKQLISKSHGIDIHWEVQLIHDKFIDQELIGDSSYFDNNHFLEG